MTIKPLTQSTAFLLVCELVAPVFVDGDLCVRRLSESGPASPRDDPLQMLVLGDSIMWGQGLREDEKFSSRVKCWLQEKTNREVRVHVEAHSGAVISVVPARRRARPSRRCSGEVNPTTPTINEQLDQRDSVLRRRTAHRPSLILMNGCINDVGVRIFWLRQLRWKICARKSDKSCGEGMHGSAAAREKQFSRRPRCSSPATIRSFRR